MAWRSLWLMVPYPGKITVNSEVWGHFRLTCFTTPKRAVGSKDRPMRQLTVVYLIDVYHILMRSMAGVYFWFYWTAVYSYVSNAFCESYWFFICLLSNVSQWDFNVCLCGFYFYPLFVELEFSCRVFVVVAVKDDNVISYRRPAAINTFFLPCLLAIGCYYYIVVFKLCIIFSINYCDLVVAHRSLFSDILCAIAIVQPPSKCR